MTVPSLRDVDVRHLAALAAVVEEGSFARAARSLGFTQSAVSQQIATLERAIGLPVFDRPRGPRAAELTAVGELLLAHAREILGRVDAMEDELDRLRRGVTGRLMVGTFQSASAALLPEIVGRMRTDVPEVEIRLAESDDQHALVRGILDDDLDLAFTVDPGDDPEVESVLLGHDPYVLMAPVGDLGGSVATPGDLRGQPMIGQSDGNICQQLIDERLEALGVRPDYVFRSQDNQAVQGMVRSGMGRAVMPYLAIDPTDPGVVVLPFDPPMSRTLMLTRRSGRSLPPAAEHFTEVAMHVGCDVLGRAGSEPAA